ncbi:MAG: TetR/AcrR family transcriptional regulator [Acidimicrobiales bacterium]
MTAIPEPTTRSGRAADIVAAARRILEEEGVEALTMRRLAGAVGMRAPSLYKHFPTKRAVEAALIEEGMVELGQALHAALRTPARGGAVRNLLEAYRRAAVGGPALYRLATAGPLPREDLPPGLEAWAGEPFFLVTGDPLRAQALFSFAHGMVILELDDRFPPGSDLGRTWKAGAAAFTR